MSFQAYRDAIEKNATRLTAKIVGLEHRRDRIGAAPSVAPHHGAEHAFDPRRAAREHTHQRHARVGAAYKGRIVDREHPEVRCDDDGFHGGEDEVNASREIGGRVRDYFFL